YDGCGQRGCLVGARLLGSGVGRRRRGLCLLAAATLATLAALAFTALAGAAVLAVPCRLLARWLLCGLGVLLGRLLRPAAGLRLLPAAVVAVAVAVAAAAVAASAAAVATRLARLALLARAALGAALSAAITLGLAFAPRGRLGRGLGTE